MTTVIVTIGRLIVKDLLLRIRVSKKAVFTEHFLKNLGIRIKKIARGKLIRVSHTVPDGTAQPAL